MEKIYEAA